ncbi:DNA-binding response OmpR family regulator [Herbihabitans rhizosphaerae]|uniref:DNA-binding response OmpR family regulator n=2 Tax=Herbihabitans rhizosphaerae TaxID=1872711 RepID=A0A4Q7KXF3_9PSEU|nr:DNA-binding response OmpR family regulator [Herbihabitans rhizosphaerae]
MAEVLHRGLSAEGFAVDIAYDGPNGLWHATEHPYDVVVLDIMLPGMHGYEVCRRLREREVSTPVLMLTAKDGEYDEAEGLDTGADDYLTKPFSYVVLVARLRALVRRGGTERGPVLRIDDLTLDPANGTCRRADTRISLTAKEQSVLEYLMRNAGKVVTKREIVDHVWDIARDVEHNLVEVYIANIRRKVDRPFGKNTITTVRGHGYLVVNDGR